MGAIARYLSQGFHANPLRLSISLLPAANSSIG